MKMATTYTNMIDNLLSRNLIISDNEFALQVLQKTNYYRLTSYFKHFYTSNRMFKNNITFEQIYNLYIFDKKLKNLFLYHLEEVEVKLKTKKNFGQI